MSADPSDLQRRLGDWLHALCGVTDFSERARFSYDDRFELSVELRAEDEACLFAATVAAVPDGERPTFCERLLQMNHPAGALGGACLALNSTKQDVLLWYQAPIAGMDLGQFEQLLANFIELAARLNTELGTQAAPDATGEVDNHPAHPDGHMVFRP